MRRNQADTDGAAGLEQAKKTKKFQSSEESAVVAGLGIWSEALSPKRTPRIEIVYGDETITKVDQGKKNIEQLTRELIAEARVALDKFEQELMQRAQRKASKPVARKQKRTSKEPTR